MLKNIGHPLLQLQVTLCCPRDIVGTCISYDKKTNSGCKNIHPYYLNVLEKWQSHNIHINTDPQNDNVSDDLLDEVITQPNFIVTGYDNKANFCYLNSIYQILICILLHKGCTYNHINSKSPYSYFATMIFNFRFNQGYQRSNRRRNLHTLRSSLGRFFPLLNGLRQQDAHEALLTILNCIHDGTKQSLIADLDDSLRHYCYNVYLYPMKLHLNQPEGSHKSMLLLL